MIPTQLLKAPTTIATTTKRVRPRTCIDLFVGVYAVQDRIYSAVCVSYSIVKAYFCDCSRQVQTVQASVCG